MSAMDVAVVALAVVIGICIGVRLVSAPGDRDSQPTRGAGTEVLHAAVSVLLDEIKQAKSRPKRKRRGKGKR